MRRGWASFRLDGQKDASEGGEISKHRAEVVGNDDLSKGLSGGSRCMLGNFLLAQKL